MSLLIPDSLLKVIACSVVVSLLLPADSVLAAGQSASPVAAQAAATAADGDPATPKLAPASARRRAEHLFLEASRQYQSGHFDEALHLYQQAAQLDPQKNEYELAANVAKSHLVTSLVEQAAQSRLKGDKAATLEALARARTLDPTSPLVLQHAAEFPAAQSAASTAVETLSAAPRLEPTPGTRSFHLHASPRQILTELLKAWGISATIDDSLRNSLVRFDLEDATFDQALRVAQMTTHSFLVPLDPHRALVATDSRENRQRFERLEMETVYLGPLSDNDYNDINNLAKNLFSIQHAVVDKEKSTLTVRAPSSTLDALNATLAQLLDGRSQVVLDLRFIELGHSKEHNTGATPPQSIQAFNVYAEEQSILNSNATTVQEIINSGLASANDPLAIIAILVASGTVSSSIFSNGFAIFGGGITMSGISPSPATLNLSVNSSDSRLLDQVQMRLADGENGTLKLGTKYPIQTSSYSNMGASASTIAGLTGTGTSSALASLYSSYTSSTATVPMVEYHDLGLTLKVTPKVMRNDDVALSLDLKLDALSGSTISGNPILNNRAYSSVATLKDGTAVVLASELNKSEARSVSGIPGLSEIPGFNDALGDKDKTISTATLLIVITPHVIRGTQAAGHSAQLRFDRNAAEVR